MVVYKQHFFSLHYSSAKKRMLMRVAKYLSILNNKAKPAKEVSYV